jgi:predicted RNA binding protein YcfA (HicA-like mRNA interferase family)
MEVEQMKFREIERLIKNDGWEYLYTTGSHYYYIHPTKPGKVTIPYHNKDLKMKTVNSILKQAGLK